MVDAVEEFERNGAVQLRGAALHVIEKIEDTLNLYPDGVAGTRIVGNSQLANLLALEGELGRKLLDFVQPHSRPVRAILFDKSETRNWALGWHQDRTIAVVSRVEVEEFGPWTVKQGIHHVQPPIAITSAMRTVRIHLDPVSPDNAPLLIALGSHRQGWIDVHTVEETVAKSCTTECLAERGDIWVYHTPILHASRASTGGARRRVLQVDYSASTLPGALEWIGV